MLLGSAWLQSAAGLLLVLPHPALGQVTQRVSLSSAGAQGDQDSGEPAISADGRFVAFESFATTLVGGDTNQSLDIFVRDRLTGATERVSVSSAGLQGLDFSFDPSISADGRFVAFMSYATTFVGGDTNGEADVFVRDRQLGLTERVSVDTGEVQGNGYSFAPSISADGRYVAFSSYATNLVPGDTNAAPDVFVRDRQQGVTERVSVDATGGQAIGDSFEPSISADGRYVAFQSLASNLVTGDSNAAWDVFVRDRQQQVTERLSLGPGGAQANDDSLEGVISADGRFVGFLSRASNLVGGDTNAMLDVFVRDRLLSWTERASVSSTELQANLDSYEPSISAEGRWMTFSSGASNLVPGDTNGAADVFVRDRQLGRTERVSVDSAGAEGDDTSVAPWISADGRYVAFPSWAQNLAPGDTNGVLDVFVRDRTGEPAFTSLCDPGVGGVAACPCGNPPSGLGRGCDNSSDTGGAILSASGSTYLSADLLVFSTRHEKPTALSVVLQGNGTTAGGAIFGMGVRCASGTLKRLYTKTASAGSIRAPDFGAGDPSVSARSAAVGDPILPGQSRWYLVFYRDPIVLGGCPSTSTFNATQTGAVAWSH